MNSEDVSVGYLAGCRWTQAVARLTVVFVAARLPGGDLKAITDLKLSDFGSARVQLV